MTVLALLTDFGLRDHFVGAVKGVILGLCPQATLVDVVHDLPPHDVMAGALALAAAQPAFPAGTVFLAVVDPGVGSGRRGLVLEAAGQLFVGPDNGVLDLVRSRHPGGAVHAITNADLFRHPVSATFHARDVFAPVAARLAAGLPLREVGPPVGDPVPLPFPEPQVSPDEVAGAVIHADRFGNLTTTIGQRELDALAAGGREMVVLLGPLVLPLARTYSDVPAGEPCALMGSSGLLEIAVNQGDAAQVLGARRGSPVRVRAVSAVL